MRDPLDTPPQGFTRSSKGWLVKSVSGADKRLQKQKEENAVLKQQLQELADRISKLEE